MKLLKIAFVSLIVAASAVSLSKPEAGRTVPSLQNSKFDVHTFLDALTEDLETALPERADFMQARDAVITDGRERAMNWRACYENHKGNITNRRRYPRVISEQLHLAYMFNAKSGTSTVRHLLGKMSDNSFTESEMNAFTYFTFVRDPLERLISGFKEESSRHTFCHENSDTKPKYDLCKIGRNPYMADPADPKQRNEVLDRFAAAFEGMEAGSWSSSHVEPQHNKLQNTRLEFLGCLNNFKQDWESLGNYQVSRHGIDYNSWPPPPQPRRRSPEAVNLVLNYTLIPGSLVQRICSYYELDYCCLGIPIPQDCHLSC